MPFAVNFTSSNRLCSSHSAVRSAESCYHIVRENKLDIDFFKNISMIYAQTFSDFCDDRFLSYHVSLFAARINSGFFKENR